MTDPADAGGAAGNPGASHHDTVSQAGYVWPTLEDLRVPRLRPGLLRWLLYVFGAGLPERHRTWVLHDTTCSTWIVRHLVRSLIMVAVPFTVVLLLVPAPIGLRLLTAFTAGGCFLMFMMVHIIETTERRVVRAGYLGGTAERLRGERSVASQRAANQQRRARETDRRERRQLRGN